MSYMTLSSQEKPLFHEKIPLRHLFFYSVRAFVPIRQHYFSKYWGTDARAVPHLKFWKNVPAVPLGLRPCLLRIINLYTAYQLPTYFPKPIHLCLPEFLRNFIDNIA